MVVNLNHGNGGYETSVLIENIFMKQFENDISKSRNDSAILKINGNIAFTTDSFVVKPVFFNGGDIGRLAVCGTVNDLLTSGALPQYLSASFIIEENAEFETLERIAESMRVSAEEAGVEIVTGDTKVIEGSGGIYINTSGIGVLHGEAIDFQSANESDAIIVTGTLGDHHACIMSRRMGIENNIRSDVAPLNDIVFNLLKNDIEIHGMRDITRGGLATVLNEISRSCGLEARIYESKIPVAEQVEGLCRILGLDPLYMGNEGKMFISVKKDHAEKALKIIRHSKYGQKAEIIGNFKAGQGVVLATKLGGERILNPLSGESLPRIC